MGGGKSLSKIGIVVCLAWILLVSNVLTAQVAFGKTGRRGKEKLPEDEAQALQWAEEALVKSGFRVNKVDSQYILYGDAKGDYGIALARVISTSVEATGGYTVRVFWQDYAHETREAMEIRQFEKFKAALDFLSAHAREEETARDEHDLALFQGQAQTWREAAAKPAMPESAREHQVLAEYAFKEKNTDKAIAEYMAALAIFPTWPEGQYNLATLAGEKHLYQTAVFHMKEYLALVPESSDAQAARDAIIVWKDRLNSLPLTAANNSAQGPRKFK